MKKIVLTLAGVLAATAFAPEASAVPAFARQTGMACNACHYQHFPLLNGFGRAFKSSGYTLMGAQGRIEGENNLSIPDTVNLGVFTTAYFQSQSKETINGVDQAADKGLGKWGVPGTGGELSLFIGGRVSEFAGFLAEAGLGGGGPTPVTGTNDPATNTVTGTADGGGVVGAAKLALLFPVGDARVGTVIYSSNDQGAAYSFELLNTGAAGTHKMMGNKGPSDQHIRAAYASQYLGTATAATGINVVGTNDMGFVNIGAYEMAGNAAVSGANNLNLTYIRAAFITDIAGWDSAIGIQNFGGKSSVTNSVVNGYNAPKATVVDAQMQGDWGAMPVGVYASYGTAAVSTATETNPFGAAVGGQTRTSFNLAAEVGVVPHIVSVQVAIRAAKNGVDAGTASTGVASGTSQTDNALMFGVHYELAQNIGLSWHHTAQSGTAWNVDSAGVVGGGKTGDTVLLEAAF